MAELTLLHGLNLWGALPGGLLTLDPNELAPQRIVETWDNATLGVEPVPPPFTNRSAVRADEVPTFVGQFAAYLHQIAGQGPTQVQCEAHADRYHIYLPSREAPFAVECLRVALRWLSSANKEPLAQLIARLDEHRDDTCLGPSTLAIVGAAERRGIPSLRLSPVDSLVQLGWGARQRRIWAAETDASGAIPNEVAQDKELTRRLLRLAGLPVPEGTTVFSPSEAWEVAQRIGLPVVVKPQTASRGRGVSIDLSTRESIEAAYEYADRWKRGIVVERYVKGVHHRILVVGERAVAASRASEEVVFGDGKHNVAQLVDRANRDPKRLHGEAGLLTFLKLDPVALELLERKGLTPDSVPPAGEKVYIHLNGDLTTDVTDIIHPETAQLCVEAARTIGLPITGVDVLVEDIAGPLDEQDGVIVEVNARPGLLMHLDPMEGTARDVATPIIDTMFTPDDNARVPTVVLSGGETRGPLHALLAQIFGALFPVVGVSSSGGVYAGKRRIRRIAVDQTDTLLPLLMDRTVLAILAELPPQTIAKEGLLLDSVDVAVLSDDDYTSERDARAAALIAVNAKHLVAPASSSVTPPVNGFIALFGEPRDERLLQHAGNGGRVAFVEGSMLVVREGQTARQWSTSGVAGSKARDLALPAAVLVGMGLGFDPARIVELLCPPLSGG